MVILLVIKQITTDVNKKSYQQEMVKSVVNLFVIEKNIFLNLN